VKLFLAGLACAVLLGVGWAYWAINRPAIGLPQTWSASSGPRDPFGRLFEPSTTLSGFVRMAGGVTHSAHVDLVRINQNGLSRWASDEVLGDGRFTFSRVPADRYFVIAHSEVDVDPMRPGEGPTRHYFGIAEATSDGEHPGRVGVALYPGGTLAGHVRVAPAPDDPNAFDAVTVSLLGADDASRAALVTIDGSASVAPDGQFLIDAVPAGRYTLGATTPSWTLDSVSVANRERLDLPFQVDHGQQIPTSIALTARPNVLGGTLRNAAGQAMPFTLVAAFSPEADQRSAARRTQLLRTDAAGAFRFSGLPSGEYLIAPAVGFDPPSWRTASFFERLAPSAVRVSIGGGAEVTRDVQWHAGR